MENLVLYVENKEVYSEAVMRSNRKVSALELAEPDRAIRARNRAVERRPASRETLMRRAQQWGRDWTEKVKQRFYAPAVAIWNRVRECVSV